MDYLNKLCPNLGGKFFSNTHYAYELSGFAELHIAFFHSLGRQPLVGGSRCSYQLELWHLVAHISGRRNKQKQSLTPHARKVKKQFLK